MSQPLGQRFPISPAQKGNSGNSQSSRFLGGTQINEIRTSGCETQDSGFWKFQERERDEFSGYVGVAAGEK